jgi:hypothetical protein
MSMLELLTFGEMMSVATFIELAVLGLIFEYA